MPHRSACGTLSGGGWEEAIAAARAGSTGRSFLLETGPLLLFLAIDLAIFREALLAGRNFYEHDTLLYYYPLAGWLAEQLRAGESPLWIPHLFSGYPIAADGEVGHFYPPNLMALWLLPLDQAMAVLRAGHLLVAAVGMYAWLRVLRLGRASASIGGLVFGFGSYTVGQLHHENVIRTAVWLPLVLLLLELALRHAGWRYQALLVVAGLVLGGSLLGLHLQPAVMAGLAVAGWGLFRVAWPAGGVTRVDPARALLRLGWSLALLLGIAGGLAAIQLIPLYELGRASFRAGGVSYEFASAFSLVPHNLPSLLFPYFFRLPGGEWWTLWHPWESTLYVGVVPLFLAGLGLVAGRREGLFFAVLGTLAFLVAMSHYGPLNLHEPLWRLPGFSFFRAPGRFSYLIVLSLAGLAALGAEWLTAKWRDTRTLAALWMAVLALLGALASLLLSWRSWLVAEPQAGRQLVQAMYLDVRHQSGQLGLETVYQGALASLDLANPKTAFSLGLLSAFAGLLLVRLLAPYARQFFAGGLAGLIALDLGVFGFDYHPQGRLADLARPAPALEWLSRFDPGSRLLAEERLLGYESNQVLLAGLSDLSGYASAPSRRHFEFWTQTLRQPGPLLDLWGGLYYLAPNRFEAAREVQGRTYYPERPLIEGGRATLSGYERFRLDGGWADQVWAIGWLSQAVRVEHGTVVAELALEQPDGKSYPLELRAGEHLSERAYDRRDVQGNVRHAKAFVVDSLQAPAPDGQSFQAHLYLAQLDLAQLIPVTFVTVRSMLPEGELSLFGLGVRERSSGRFRSLAPGDRARFEAVYTDVDVTLYRNAQAFPRAFVVYDAVVYESMPHQTPLSQVLSSAFDPASQVLLEGYQPSPRSADGPLPRAVSGDTGPRQPAAFALQPHAPHGPQAAEVVDVSPARVLVRAELERSGYLVLTDLYHRGWTARVDGTLVPVYLANSMFRGLPLSPGPHTVEFVFDPLSFRLGGFISLGTALVAGAVLTPWMVGMRRSRRRPV